MPLAHPGRRTLLCALLLLAACSGGDDKSSDPTTTPPATTTATSTTTVVPASTSPPTTVLVVPSTQAPTSAPVTTPVPTTVPGPTAARLALDPFLASVQQVMDTAGVLWPMVDTARSAGVEDIPEESWPAVDDLSSEFYGLANLVPHGVDATVRAAAVKVLYDVGNHVAPFVFAPGLELLQWDPAWDEARTRGVEDLPVDRDALFAAAASAGEVRAVPPTSQEVAAGGVLEVVVGRSFGHSLSPEPLPYSVRWLGELPPVDPDFEIPFCADVPFGGGEFTGEFAQGVGGCAIVYYDTTDPAEHEDALAAFLADPLSVEAPPGEIVTVVWDTESARFMVYGSWE